MKKVFLSGKSPGKEKLLESECRSAFLLQTVDLVGISILYHLQEHVILVVVILDLNKDMALVARCERA